MRSLLPILMAILAAQAPVNGHPQPAAADPHNLAEKFEAFKLEQSKTYASDSAEHAKRFAIFQSTWHSVRAHNERFARGEESYGQAINKFADQTIEEVVGPSPPSDRNDDGNGGEPFVPSDDPLPDNVDWRKEGYVTPVKNQGPGPCGSGWAFSATGAVEGAHFKIHKQLVSLSEQNLIDCSWAEGNVGCSGGLPRYAFQYVCDKQGIATEESYPYTGKDDKCTFNTSTIGAKLSWYVELPSGDELALQQAVAEIGPVSAIVRATDKFKNYNGIGVLDDSTCDEDGNHAVLVVGYGKEDDGKEFWLVKNCWGEDWAGPMKGYIKMSRNKDNQCRISDRGVYAVEKKPK